MLEGEKGTWDEADEDLFLIRLPASTMLHTASFAPHPPSLCRCLQCLPARMHPLRPNYGPALVREERQVLTF